MIGKVTAGTSFQGLQAYLVHGKDGRQRDRVAWIASRNLMSDDPELAARIMRATAQRSVRVEHPVYHLSISLPPGEHLDREGMLAVADRTLRDLDLHEHQVLIVAHNDTPHQHIHLVINRVHPETGRAWHRGHDYARIEKSLRHQERERRIREVPGRHYVLPEQERHRGVEVSSGDRRFEDRTGERPFADHVRQVAGKDLREARSWGELHRALGEYGLRFEKRGRGLVITDGERRVKASFVDRRSSLHHLQKRLGRYQPPEKIHELAWRAERWRDIHELRRATDGLARHRDADRQARREAGAQLRRQDAKEETLRLERQVEAVSTELDGHLRRVFRDPASARRQLDELSRRRGVSEATRQLASRPQRFGTLRGRGGPLPSAAREHALQTARFAATTIRDLADARSDLAKHLTKLASKTIESKRSRSWRQRPRPGRPRADLGRTAGRLAKRLGWKLVARVIPVPHFQLLRLTLSLTKRAMDMSLELGRGVAR